MYLQLTNYSKFFNQRKERNKGFLFKILEFNGAVNGAVFSADIPSTS